LPYRKWGNVEHSERRLLELATQESSPTPASGDCRAFPSEQLRSPDNAKVYPVYGSEQTDMWTGLRVLDATTGHVLGGIETSVAFWSTALSEEGKFIYALAPEHHRGW
jgi:hypothetical protein